MMKPVRCLPETFPVETSVAIWSSHPPCLAGSAALAARRRKFRPQVEEGDAQSLRGKLNFKKALRLRSRPATRPKKKWHRSRLTELLETIMAVVERNRRAVAGVKGVRVTSRSQTGDGKKFQV
mmetsp:Transcript_3197/g.8321  ORF Transcript_3197/g.8321 Transcript_3197/m.8321 type:complete len:123 (+) Transcript_3197:1281-1649(+)